MKSKWLIEELCEQADGCAATDREMNSVVIEDDDVPQTPAEEEQRAQVRDVNFAKSPGVS